TVLHRVRLRQQRPRRQDGVRRAASSSASGPGASVASSSARASRGSSRAGMRAPRRERSELLSPSSGAALCAPQARSSTRASARRRRGGADVEPNDAIADLLHQAAQIIGSPAGSTSAEHAENAYRTLTTLAQAGDHVSLGLYPLALAILIFHENFQAATGDGRFRVAYVLGRAAAIAALIHPWRYGRLCGLITYAAGGHAGRPSADPRPH